MTHTIENRVGAIRARVRRTLLSHAAGYTLAVVTGVGVALCLADYLLRFQDPGLRVISTGVWLAAGVWALWRFVLTATLHRLDDIELARRIETRFPRLAERLASAVEFLKHAEDDPLAGSPELRRRVIAEVAAEVDTIDPRAVVDTRPSRRAMLVAGGAVAVAAVLAALDPHSASVAATRLVLPLGGAEWPKQNHLMFVEPVRRLALGQTFEVQVVDAEDRELPDRVLIQFRHDDQGVEPIMTEAMRRAGDAVVARRENVARPFWYRAEGGDDRSMDWIHVEVVEPPSIEALTVTTTSPEYTALGRSVFSTHLDVLAGSLARFDARVNKPLRSAKIKLESGQEFTGAVASDGLSFTAPAEGAGDIVIDRSGSYWFELEDNEGFIGGADVRYEIRATPDQLPSVNIVAPTGGLFFTPQAIVPIEAVAKDDLAIARIELAYTPLDEAKRPETLVPLYVGPEKALPPLTAEGVAAVSPRGEERSVAHGWDLSPLNLTPGMHVSWRVTATDYKPQTGESAARRISIITASEFQDRLAERQNFILGELARLLKLERGARSQVGGVEIQLDQVGSLNKQDIDHLQSAELVQRQVDRGLTDGADGVAGNIQRLLDDMRNNRVDTSDVEPRLGAVLSEIERLETESLPAIGRELTGAIKGFQGGEPANSEPRHGDEEAARSLAAAGQMQDQVVESLEHLLEDFAQWDRYGRFQREVAQLERDQEALSQEAAELGKETLTRAFNDLDSQQQANLAKIGQRQAELAARFDRLQQRMQEATDQLNAADPVAAATLSDALDEARGEAVGGRMRQAAKALGENQVGQAAAEQAAAREALSEMMSILTNRRESELSRLVKKLREAEDELGQLLEKQRGLRKKMEDLAADMSKSEAERRRELERLSAEERELQKEVERFARTLRRLQADQAGRTAARGAAKQGQSSDSGQQGDAATAAGQAAEAESDLDEAAQQLAERRNQAEMDLADEQLARLEDTALNLKNRQERLLAETREYEAVRNAGGLSRAQAMSVQDLSRQEAALAEETRILKGSLVGAEGFQFVLDRAAVDMGRGASMLARLNTADDTQRILTSALRRVERLIEAMASDQEPQPQGAGQEGEGQAGGEGGGQGGGEEPPSLAELKLLKLLQLDVNQRTAELAELAQDDPARAAAAADEFTALAEEQGKLADLLLDLAAPQGETSPEEALELPDIDDLAPRESP